MFQNDRELVTSPVVLVRDPNPDPNLACTHQRDRTTNIRGGSRNSSGGGVSGPEFFKGGGLGSRSAGIFIY